MALDHLDQPPLEDGRSGQEEVGHGAEGVEVAPRVRRHPVLDRLRREVLRRPGEDVVARQAGVRSRDVLHEPEVDDLGEVGDAAYLCQQDVRGLDVAVDEADAVRLGQGLAHLDEDVHGAARRERPSLATRRSRSIPSRYSIT